MFSLFFHYNFVQKKQKELTETFRAQLSTMVCGNEWKKLQELHQSDAIEIVSIHKKLLEYLPNVNEFHQSVADVSPFLKQLLMITASYQPQTVSIIM